MTTPTIYVAGSSKELARAREAMTAAESLGFRVLLDWVADIEREGSANDVPEDVAIRCADADLEAACTADVMWLLLSEHTSKGMMAELGARIATRGRSTIVASGANGAATIFYAGFPRFESDEEALAFLAGFRRALELATRQRDAAERSCAEAIERGEPLAVAPEGRT